MAFKARYSEGYRYLDHCGETIIRIQGRDRSWQLGSSVREMPEGTAMASEALGGRPLIWYAEVQYIRLK